jgi:hypothetical protein
MEVLVSGYVLLYLRKEKNKLKGRSTPKLEDLHGIYASKEVKNALKFGLVFSPAVWLPLPS